MKIEINFKSFNIFNKKNIQDFIIILRKKWLETIAASIISVIISLAVYYFWIPLKNYSQKIYLDKTNISEGKALEYAKMRIGSEATHAILFLNTGEPYQYIFVLKGNVPKKNVSFCLLKGINGVYEIIELNNSKVEFTDLYWPYPHDETALDFNVIDVDKDGKKEVYLFYVDSGMGSNYMFLSIYDTFSKNYYGITDIGVWATEVTEPIFVGNIDEKYGLREWIVNKVGPKIDEKELKTVSTLNNAEIIWKRYNGADFTIGKLNLFHYPGDIQQGPWNSIHCEAETDTSIWRIMFKGGIVKYDKINNEHCLIYVKDPFNFGSIPNLIIGKRYVWFSIRFDDMLLAYDKENESIVGFQISEWNKYKNDHSDHLIRHNKAIQQLQKTNAVDDQLRDHIERRKESFTNDLYVSGSNIFEYCESELYIKCVDRKSKILTLITEIDLSNEFDDAIVCED